MEFELKEFTGDNTYTTKECEFFIEKYCIQHNISSKDLAGDIDHFELVLSLYDKHIKENGKEII